MLSSHSAGGNTDEELCNRWMQLAAFTPFFRNHNVRGAISQEPYRWDSVAHATRAATAVRYALLPYWVRSLALLARLLPTSVPLTRDTLLVHAICKLVPVRHATHACTLFRISARVGVACG